MLKEELIEALEILERNGVSEQKQRDILLNGINFDYTWGDPDPQRLNRKLNFFQVAELYKTLNNLDCDVNDITADEYGEVVRAIADKEKNGTPKIVVIGRSKK